MKIGEEIGEEVGEEGSKKEGRKAGRGRTIVIKSNNSHLAGGEKMKKHETPQQYQ